jgi:hypothetical protein
MLTPTGLPLRRGDGPNLQKIEKQVVFARAFLFVNEPLASSGYCGNCVGCFWRTHETNPEGPWRWFHQLGLMIVSGKAIILRVLDPRT